MMLILRRLGAYVCDTVLLYLVAFLCLTIFMIPYASKDILAAIKLNPDLLTNRALFSEMIENLLPLSLVFLATVILLIVSLIYFALSESSRSQATLGKRLFKLKVASDQDGRISKWHACQRFFWFALPDILYLLLYIVKNDPQPGTQFNITTFAIWFMRVLWYFPIFITQDKRCAYDILSRTKVISR